MSTLRLNGSTSGYVELSAPAVAGSTALTVPFGVIQAVQDTDNVDSSYSLSAYGTTGNVLEVSITPTFANSKMLIMANVNGGTDYDIMGARMMKNGSVMNGPNGDATDANNRWRAFSMVELKTTSAYGHASMSTVHLETLSGASTSTAITYAVQLINTDNVSRTVYLNRASSDSDTSTNVGRTASNLIVMEIAP